MITLLLALLVLCVVVYIIRTLLPTLGLPEPFTTAVVLIVALVALLWPATARPRGAPAVITLLIAVHVTLAVGFYLWFLAQPRTLPEQP